LERLLFVHAHAREIPGQQPAASCGVELAMTRPISYPAHHLGNTVPHLRSLLTADESDTPPAPIKRKGKAAAPAPAKRRKSSSKEPTKVCVYLRERASKHMCAAARGCALCGDHWCRERGCLLCM